MRFDVNGTTWCANRGRGGVLYIMDSTGRLNQKGIPLFESSEIGKGRDFTS